MKIGTSVEISERDIDDAVYDVMDQKKNRFNELFQKLRVLEKRNMETKIETMRVLAEIYDDGLYVAGGYKQFGEFIKACSISNARVYIFVKIGQKLREGVITEQDIIKNGIDNMKAIIQTNNYKVLETGEGMSKINPLRIMLPTDTSYKYFKSNTKFASYALSRLYEEHRHLLDTFYYEYSQEKKHKKAHEAEEAIEMEAIEDTGQKDTKQIEE